MITRIHHVAVVVRSLDQALVFYRDVLGIPLAGRATVAEQGVHAALLLLGEGEIELLEPATPSSGVARFLERKGEGLHHLTVETSDIAAALARAKALGLPMVDQAPRPGLAGTIAFLHPGACHGVLVELAQPLAGPHPGVESGGVRAMGIDTVYVAVPDLSAAATTFARNFGGKATEVETDPRLGARRVVVGIGRSRLTLVSAADLKASPDPGPSLLTRGDGLVGVGLAVADFEGAIRHLDAAGIPANVRAAGTADPLAYVGPRCTHGVHLFLRPAPPPPLA